MTLCIGALAQENLQPRIVLCFDSKIATNEFSSEREYKFHRLSGQLTSMFCNIPGRAKELAWIYREFLQTEKLDKRRVIDQLREPVKTFRRRLANAYLGRTLGLSYDEVLKNGAKWFGKEFRDKLLRLEAHELGVDLIIAGFIGQFPVLCELADGNLEWKTSMAIIGSGAYTATPTMHARNHSDSTPLTKAIYHVYEAQKIGQSSPFVGKHPTILVLRPPDVLGDSVGIHHITPEGLNYLDNLYDQYGPKPVPHLPAIPDECLVKSN